MDPVLRAYVSIQSKAKQEKVFEMNGSENNQIVYVLVNPAMPGMVKLGKTTQTDVEARMSQLYSTGVPLPFECVYAVEVEDCSKVETALHIAFGPARVNPKREFFDIDPEQAIAILKLLGKAEVTPKINAQLNVNVSEAEKSSSEQTLKKRPNLNFREMGIPENSVLVFTENENIVVKVISEKKVEYNGEIVSLTRATRLALGLDYNVQPGRYWLLNGKSIHEYYNETYTVDDI